MTTQWRKLELGLLKEMLYDRVMYPGLEVFILPKKGYQKKYAVFSTRFGSIDSRFQTGDEGYLDVPEGVAHFLEHKLFESEQGDVFDRFAQLGASANAFTSFTQTSYLFSSTDNFLECLELLIDFVQQPFFSEETVAKEQGIIAQEIRMYEDNPQWRIFFNILGALYRDHPVRQDIAGTVNSIRQITPQILYQCYRTFYHPGNMALFVVGDVDIAEVDELIERNLKSRDYSEPAEIKRFYPPEPDGVNKRNVSQNMAVSEPLLNLGFKDNNPEKLTGDEKMRLELVTELLLDIIFSRSEPLYNLLYEEGLINDYFEAGYVVERNYAYTLLGSETRDPDLLYERIMDGISRLKETGLTEEQVERHRRAMIGSFMRRFNSLEFVANNMLAYRFREMNFFSYPDILKEITPEEINERLHEHLTLDRHALSVILPVQ